MKKQVSSNPKGSKKTTKVVPFVKKGSKVFNDFDEARKEDFSERNDKEELTETTVVTTETVTVQPESTAVIEEGNTYEFRKGKVVIPMCKVVKIHKKLVESVDQATGKTVWSYKTELF